MADDTKPAGPVYTYTRTYRIETGSMTEEEIINYAQQASPLAVNDLLDAFDVFSRLSDQYGTGEHDPEDKVKIELHNTAHEKRDPGFF